MRQLYLLLGKRQSKLDKTRILATVSAHAALAARAITVARLLILKSSRVTKLAEPAPYERKTTIRSVSQHEFINSCVSGLF